MATLTASAVPLLRGRFSRLPGAVYAVGVGGSLAAVAAASGGYFPTSWGWTALGFAWLALIALLVSRDTALTPEGVTFLGAMLALTTWTFASAAWSWDVGETVLEGEHTLVLMTAGAALLLLTRGRRDVLLGSLLAAVTGICSYSLATRVFPAAVGRFDASGIYRLSTPLGYWNSLGLFAVIGSLLALGFVARGRTLAARGAAAAALVVLAPTIFFTFSRGSWLALGIALVFMLALDPRRLQSSVALAVAAPAPAAAVLLASRAHALTTVGATQAAAVHQGHRLAIAFAVLMPAAALMAVGLGFVERLYTPGRLVRAAYAAVLLAAIVVGLTTVVVRWGSPQTLAQRTWDAFASPPRTTTDLNKRLFQFSSNGRLDLWHVALQEYRSAPLAGTGGGTYDLWWYQQRPIAAQVLDAHSLYLQTLGELGLVGLALLVLAFGAPLVGAWRSRHRPLVPFAAAGLVAYLAHAAADWDWEITAVTLVALACATALVEPDGSGTVPIGRRARALGVTAAVAVAGAALVAIVGNRALANVGGALVQGDRARAFTEARRAADWMPWSGQPLILVGELQAGRGNPEQGLRTLHDAVAKEPRSYLAWYALAETATGATQRRAAAQVVRLNPRSDEATEMRQLLAKRP
jgi:O-antigen ligase